MKNGLKVIVLLKAIILSLAIAITGCLYAIVPEMEIWSNGKQYLYLLKDWHLDYFDATSTVKQHHDLLWALQQKKSSSLLIAEDLISLSDSCSIEEYNDRVKKLYLSESETNPLGPHYRRAEYKKRGLFQLSPLTCLIYTCTKQNINTYNAECAKETNKYEFTRFLSTKQSLSHRRSIIKDLSTHLDKIKANKFFSENYTQLKSKLAQLKHILKLSNKKHFLEEASAIRGLLLELKTVHQLSVSSSFDHIFIYEGGKHIENIMPYVAKLGYKHIKTVIVPIPITGIPEDPYDCLEYVIKHPLDLQQTFTEIFNEQLSSQQ